MENDFYFDGHTLSEFGFMVCSFDRGSGAENISNGSNISFQTVPVNNGKLHINTSYSYGECLTATFSICKNPCGFDGDQNALYLTTEEIRDMSKWLNREKNCEFRLLRDGYENIYYKGSFVNIELVKLGLDIIGMTLTFQSNRPFGLMDRVSKSYRVTSSANTIEVLNESDVIGTQRIRMEVTCSQSGDLDILNQTTGKHTIVKACSNGEKIVIDYPTLESSVSTHKVYNGFNFVFPEIVNSVDNKRNTFSFSIPCSVVVSYEPIVKVGIV